MVDRAAAERSLRDLKGALAGATDDPAVVAALKTAEGWDSNLKVFALGHLDADVLIRGARGGAMPWWEPLAAMTFFGRLDDLRRVHAAMEADAGLSTSKPDLSTTMTWGAWSFPIVDNVLPAFSEAIMNQFFDWGANPHYVAYGGETYFSKALQASPAGVIRSFLTHGAPQPEACRVRDSFLGAGNYKQAGEIQQALDLGGLYTKVDERTVMETKYISEPGRSSTLRTVFNFGARRVNEVFETQGTGSAMTSCNFEDYDRLAVEAARAALEKLGGTAENVCALDKKKKPSLARG